MEKIAISLLLFLSGLLGVNSTPNDAGSWNLTQNWKVEGDHFVLKAESSQIPLSCRENPKNNLQTPMIIHGVHQIFGDGKLIFQSGDPSFNTTSSFYSAPTVNCHTLASYSNIQWVAHGYSEYFSRFSHFPQIQKASSGALFKSISMNILSAGALIMLAIFSAVVFFNKISRTLAFNIIGSCLFFSFYFTFVTLDHFPIELSMLMSHKIADLSLWTAAFFFINGLWEKQVIGKLSFHIFLCAASFAIFFILLGKNGDVVQLGTTIPFPVVMIILIRSLFGEWKKYQSSKQQANLLYFLSVFTFTLSAHHDILVVTGALPGYPLFSVGVLFAIFTLTYAVNDEVTHTYNERDELLHSLEEKVEEKTLGLRQALLEKEQAQAELIQNAKLASLGTLSAGIAHEINNSINYVNGAIVPLEKLMQGADLDENKKTLMMKLLKSIKDGSSMTVDIVRSLRNYTGLNQAKYTDVNLKETANNIMVILKNKYSNRITIHNNIDETIHVYGSKVGINQVFMNLVSNAIDAIEKEGEIKITAQDSENSVTINIQDSGPGIPKDKIENIFDPFFTTKDVGKGTGLGLHIVKKEIESHKGQISVQNSSEGGACFTIELPKNNFENQVREAS